MPTSGFWNASFRHLYPGIYRLHPDQRQSGGGVAGWCAGGALAPGTTHLRRRGLSLGTTRMVGAEGRGRLLRVGMPNPGLWTEASRHPYPAYLPRIS